MSTGPQLYLHVEAKIVGEINPDGSCLGQAILKIGFIEKQSIKERTGQYVTHSANPEPLCVIQGGKATDKVMQKYYHPGIRKELSIKYAKKLVKAFPRFDCIEACIWEAKYLCIKNDSYKYIYKSEDELILHLIKFAERTVDFKTKREFDSYFKKNQKRTDQLIEEYHSPQTSSSRKHDIMYRNAKSFIYRGLEMDYEKDYVEYFASSDKRGPICNDLIKICEQKLVEKMKSNGLIS